MIWSGWEGDQNGEQDIYIVRLKNATTVESARVKISVPTHSWERFGDLQHVGNPAHVNVNEGPEIIKHRDKSF